MYPEAKKLHLIEEVLKIKNEDILAALEVFLKNSKKENFFSRNSNLDKFSGIWSKDEADEIERVIAESCEIIHPDDWK